MICLICVVLFGGDFNYVMDDFVVYFIFEYRVFRDLDELSGVWYVCRMFYFGWGLGGFCVCRLNMYFISSFIGGFFFF